MNRLAMRGGKVHSAQSTSHSKKIKIRLLITSCYLCGFKVWQLNSRRISDL